MTGLEADKFHCQIIRTMDALSLCLKKLCSDFMRYGISYGIEAVDSKRMITESFDDLIKQLKEMMVGYVTEEVQALLKEMEGEMAGIAWYRFEETVMGQMLENARPLVKEVWYEDAWYNYEEILTIIYVDLMHKEKEAYNRHEETVVRYLQAMQKETGDRQDWYRVEKKKLDKIVGLCEQLYNIRYNSNIEGEEVVVGFDDEVEILLHQLTGTCSKQLQIISISGMAGLGKTTLARRLYTDPLVEYMFDIRAWTCVSQVYLKKDLLLGILGSFIDDLTDEIYKMSDEQLGEKLYRLLKGRKYLVVFDDIWDGVAWIDLKIYFPDDKTGSRILFTSRGMDVSLNVKITHLAHVLRLRTIDESWGIFQKKVFRTGTCPLFLEDYGRAITIKCEGLPLAIVIAAGLLKNNWSNSWWKQIAESLSSYMVSDPSRYMDSLALSYNHLPPHLRLCFLFFGAFPEDYEIPVTKLIWLWIAHGFIHETGSRILEDVAEDFLMDLIKRGLVMTSKIRADGQVKTCRIHDLLRDFILRKAEEEDFMSKMHRYGKVSSMVCSPLGLGELLQDGISIPIDVYKFLKVLDVESIPISSFPSDTVQLVNLRYLAIQADDGSLQPSISNLVNLQILIISSRKNIVVPKTIWSMVNLRHLCIKPGKNLIEEPRIGFTSTLASLQTLYLVSPQSSPNIFSRTPNLRKLGFCGPLISNLGDVEFPNLDSLPHLQKLKLLNTVSYRRATKSCNPIMFPEKLKKLTLSYTGMAWEEMWKFSWLPNLEVLKLRIHACIGERWDTGDAEFGKLKVLKLYDQVDMKQWVSSRDNFPRLQRLVVHRCLKLESIPLDLGNILTLEVIDISGSSTSAHNSALEIQEQQEQEGNSFLKVHAKQNSTFRKSNSMRQSLY